ncbi:MAG TPA: hypothetical protein VK582_01490 [Pyrinomonadaceae bacterium]|nr:hypothetical protein [Pyrinomonadaceae bacterium]
MSVKSSSISLLAASGPGRSRYGTIVALETIGRIAGAQVINQRFDVPHGDGDSRQGKRNQ